MKYRTHSDEIKYSCSLISLLSNESIEKLNSIFNTHYTRENIKKRIKVLRKQRKFKFWDKLIREKPGFDKRGED